MAFVFFIHKGSSGHGKRLKAVAEKEFSGYGIQIIQAFDALRARLKQLSDYEKEVFILLADSFDRLNKLITLSDLLEDRRVILILPDDSKASLSRAALFFPRFFTPVSNTYEDVCSVLSKMIDRQ